MPPPKKKPLNWGAFIVLVMGCVLLSLLFTNFRYYLSDDIIIGSGLVWNWEEFMLVVYGFFVYGFIAIWFMKKQREIKK